MWKEGQKEYILKRTQSKLMKKDKLMTNTRHGVEMASWKN